MNPFWGITNYWGQPQGRYYHPHVYYPPTPYTSPAPLTGGMISSYLPHTPVITINLPAQLIPSKKYPSLSPCLAANSCSIHPDFRIKPRTYIPPATFNAFSYFPAMGYHVTHMRLICKSFPWKIDIVSRSSITVGAIWNEIYVALQEHLCDSEWAIAGRNKRKTIEKAAEKRRMFDGDKALKRIDWLGENTVFKGLEKNEGLEKSRLLPRATAVPETWVIKLGSR
ncbi:hypothetical protein VKT23_014175 [Stygiomarasmius scandens]|uniref:DUF6699 domain-containing protein n=1 Tax=Marasmiellus scandens TaxID=2682957 RepID=A0ABR1J426_9AGAR